MENSSLRSVSAWLVVETMHGSRLEFILAAADDRNNGGHIYHTFSEYTERLADMLKDKGLNVEEYQEYGDIMFRIYSDNIIQLQADILTFDFVVSKWINKYNINKMMG